MIRFRLFLFVWISIGGLYAGVRFPALFFNNMVLHKESELAIRYAIKNFAVVDFYSAEGIPPFSFLTDKF